MADELGNVDTELFVARLDATGVPGSELILESMESSTKRIPRCPPG
jgi:hypothetical protein